MTDCIRMRNNKEEETRRSKALRTRLQRPWQSDADDRVRLRVENWTY